jgi:hypothetical protein
LLIAAIGHPVEEAIVSNPSGVDFRRTPWLIQTFWLAGVPLKSADPVSASILVCPNSL